MRESTRQKVEALWLEDPDITGAEAAELLRIARSTAQTYLRDLRGYVYKSYEHEMSDDGFWEQVKRCQDERFAH